MNLGIDGKLALVTGSTAGIGLATARALAEEGARVTVNGRTKARVMQAVDYLKRELPEARVEGIAADEVASMIAYVCSARASATTGAALRVDGGVVRAIV